MEARPAPKIVYKMRRWLSKSRSSKHYASVESKAKPAGGAFPFLRLPSEIRNKIYRELLLDTRPLIVHLRRVHRFDAGTKPYPAILLVNRQVHDEAAAVLYGENIWFSAAPISLFSWADELYEESSSTYIPEPAPINTYLPWIKHFVLFPDGPPNWVRHKVLKVGDVSLFLGRMGIQRHDLTRLIVGVLSEDMCDEIVDDNQSWLERIDETEMQRRFHWFSGRRTEPAFWLVSKE